MPPTLARPWSGPKLEAGSATVLLNTLNGRDSLLPPKIEEGASARTEALVSRELRRRRFEEDARVSIDALSVSKLLAVAVLYVAGWPPLEGCTT